VRKLRRSWHLPGHWHQVSPEGKTAEPCKRLEQTHTHGVRVRRFFLGQFTLIGRCLDSTKSRHISVRDTYSWPARTCHHRGSRDGKMHAAKKTQLRRNPCPGESCREKNSQRGRVPTTGEICVAMGTNTNNSSGRGNNLPWCREPALPVKAPIDLSSEVSIAVSAT